MRPTLLSGDITICARSRDITRGRIVVFMHPTERRWVVKRVVGLPGDTLSYVRKILTVNGEIASKTVVQKLPLDDPMDHMLEETVAGVTFRILESYGSPLVEVPKRTLEGYFVLGDSRDDSQDSREIGEIPMSAIRCKVLGVVASEGEKGFRFDRARLL